MKIRNRLNPSQPCFSFEFFPPRTPEGEEKLLATLRELAELDPGFVSVTDGAGGSAHQKTVNLVQRIRQETGLEVMTHLTCAGHTREEMRAVLQQLNDAKLDNVLVLRGDPPQGQSQFVAKEGGFQHASEAVEFIREEDFRFCLGGACYPEGHVETLSREEDLLHLKRKVDAGLDFVITQLFFDNAFYFDFVERARRVGINVPIVPGIMPITNFEQLHRFVRLCGSTVPMRLALQLEKVKDQPQALMQLGVAHATVQCMELLQRGVPGIHFYTLNQSPATRMIVSALKGRS